MKDEFYRHTWAEIQLDAIEENLKAIRKVLPPSTSIMAVVKANGYGHGALETAEVALETGAELLGVALLDEALYLRKNGIRAPILVLGHCPPEYAPIAAKHSISLTVYQKDWLLQAKKVLSKPVAIHIKVDTGMGRIGVQTEEELFELLTELNLSDSFIFEGIFTHFAKADSKDTEYYQTQLERFLRTLEVVKEKPRWIHASNSAASLLHETGQFNLARIGIAMYGLTPSPEIADILPVKLQGALSLHSTLIHVKKVPKGAKISYGCTYEAEEEEWIGTIPIGYADGWIRALQGQEVLVNGLRAPIVGRICMDQCMVKLPGKMPIGTKVTLIGKSGHEEITVDEIAKKLGTINYEVACMISSRIPRIYKRGEQIVKIKNPLSHR